MFGSHLSIAGGMVNALDEAGRLGLDCVQVFTKNQQQWRVPPLEAQAESAWREGVARLGWAGRTVSHASYLINLASHDDELRRKSVDLMREEIERCERLGIGFLVHHPGSFTATTFDAGAARIADSYAELMASTRGYRTVMCLENTAGGGSTMGRRFDELARIRATIIDASGDPGRVGYCFDTCHAHAAGYDLSSAERARAALDELDRVCGVANVRVVHVNDSKGAAGSRLDRHQHIGAGTIGLEGFRIVVTHPVLGALPKIMETPKGEAEDGTPLDTLNVRVLRGLAAGLSAGELSPVRGAAHHPAAARKKAAASKPAKTPRGTAGAGTRKPTRADRARARASSRSDTTAGRKAARASGKKKRTR